MQPGNESRDASLSKPAQEPHREAEGKARPTSSEQTLHHYDESYYASYSDGLGYGRCAHWLDMFAQLAENLIAHVKPATALDAGCAKGFLVESLRDRGVDAKGIDLSPYAISQVREDIAHYCRVGSLTESLGGPYDLITCIEVMEHLPPAEEKLAFQRLTEATDCIFFSSSPDRDDDPTHYNVRPMRYWVERFAEYGFYPDADFEPNFSFQSFLVRRRKPDDAAYLNAYSSILDLRRKYAKLVQAQYLGEKDLKAIEGFISGSTDYESDGAAALVFRVQALEGRIAAMERSVGWRILSSYRSWLRNSVRTRPVFARVFEPIATNIVSWFAPGSSKTTEPVHATTLAETVVAQASTGGDVLVTCDYPPEGKTTRIFGSLAVQGWAASRTGIDRVEVRVGSFGPYRAKFGQSSTMIGAYLPDFEGSDHSYFRCEVPIGELDEGPHYLEVEAYANDGTTAKAVRRVIVEHRDAYSVWLDNEPASQLTVSDIREPHPKISIITPVYRTPLRWLQSCVESVRAQTYSNWELCLIDDASADQELARVLQDYAEQDPRIRVLTLQANQGIAGASNAGIEMATGDYIAFLDHDDDLAPFALTEVAHALQSEKRPDVVYSDEDMINTEGVRYGPVFKPQFSRELLRSFNYVCHFLVVRATLLRQLGGIRTGFDGSQDYDLVLRLSERTEHFHRIPKILYHWRAIPGSTALDLNSKPKASGAGLRALQDHLDRVGLPATVREKSPCRYEARYQLQQEPEVLIVVPTGGNLPRLQECLKSVLSLTRYSNFQLMVVDNSRGSTIVDHVASYNDPRLIVRDFRNEPFNFSRLCNLAVSDSSAPIFLFLNDDTEVKEADWLRVMVEAATVPGVGAVGARLLYPDGSIQHAGVTMGVYQLCGHAFRLQDGKEGHYMSLAQSVRNCSAVTGACLMTHREVFERVGRFDEVEFPVNLQDVDYCLKVNAQGLRVVYTPDATLLHYETSTRKEFGASEREMQVLRERWGAWIDDDPFYNPNLTRTAEDYSWNFKAAYSFPEQS